MLSRLMEKSNRIWGLVLESRFSTVVHIFNIMSLSHIIDPQMLPHRKDLQDKTYSKIEGLYWVLYKEDQTELSVEYLSSQCFNKIINKSLTYDLLVLLPPISDQYCFDL